MMRKTCLILQVAEGWKELRQTTYTVQKNSYKKVNGKMYSMLSAAYNGHLIHLIRLKGECVF
jgi:hypothetical protein